MWVSGNQGQRETGAPVRFFLLRRTFTGDESPLGGVTALFLGGRGGVFQAFHFS